MFTDSTAARGVASRSGVGRLRGLDTKVLWLQDHIKDGSITLKKVDGTKNVADLGTKILAMKRLLMLCTDAGLVRFDSDSMKITQLSVED